MIDIPPITAEYQRLTPPELGMVPLLPDKRLHRPSPASWVSGSQVTNTNCVPVLQTQDLLFDETSFSFFDVFTNLYPPEGGGVTGQVLLFRKY